MPRLEEERFIASLRGSKDTSVCSHSKVVFDAATRTNRAIAAVGRGASATPIWRRFATPPPPKAAVSAFQRPTSAKRPRKETSSAFMNAANHPPVVSFSSEQQSPRSVAANQKRQDVLFSHEDYSCDEASGIAEEGGEVFHRQAIRALEEMLDAEVRLLREQSARTFANAKVFRKPLPSLSALHRAVFERTRVAKMGIAPPPPVLGVAEASPFVSPARQPLSSPPRPSTAAALTSPPCAASSGIASVHRRMVDIIADIVSPPRPTATGVEKDESVITLGSTGGMVFGAPPPPQAMSLSPIREVDPPHDAGRAKEEELATGRELGRLFMKKPAVMPNPAASSSPLHRTAQVGKPEKAPVRTYNDAKDRRIRRELIAELKLMEQQQPKRLVSPPRKVNRRQQQQYKRAQQQRQQSYSPALSPRPSGGSRGCWFDSELASRRMLLQQRHGPGKLTSPPQPSKCKTVEITSIQLVDVDADAGAAASSEFPTVVPIKQVEVSGTQPKEEKKENSVESARAFSVVDAATSTANDGVVEAEKELGSKQQTEKEEEEREQQQQQQEHQQENKSEESTEVAQEEVSVSSGDDASTSSSSDSQGDDNNNEQQLQEEEEVSEKEHLLVVDSHQSEPHKQEKSSVEESATILPLFKPSSVELPLCGVKQLLLGSKYNAAVHELAAIRTKAEDLLQRQLLTEEPLGKDGIEGGGEVGGLEYRWQVIDQLEGELHKCNARGDKLRRVYNYLQALTSSKSSVTAAAEAAS